MLGLGMAWNLPLEFKYFSAKTKQIERSGTMNVCIMGRATWDSMDPKYRPLKGRFTVVLSRNAAGARQASQIPDEVPVLPSIEHALHWCLSPDRSASIGKIWILGGVSLYNQGMRVSFYLFFLFFWHFLMTSHLDATMSRNLSYSH
jgi:dihydrofolate reductase